MARRQSRARRQPISRLVDASEVAIGTGPEGPFAYRRSSLIIRHGGNMAARDRAVEVLSRLVEVEPEDSGELLRVEATDGRDLSPNIAPLASAGVDVQHNHLFFATCSCCPPHPSVAWGPCGPLAGNPLWATGLAGNPLWATGLAGNPLWATGLAGNPLWATGLAGNPLWATVAGTFAGAGGRGYRSDAGTTAAPVVGPELQRLVARVGAAPTKLAFALRVVVLDSGLADPGERPLSAWLGAAAMGSKAVTGGGQPADPNRDTADEDSDDRLDRVDGHGTFIAGVIGKLVPGATVDVVRLFAGNGIADEWNLRDRLLEVAKQSSAPHLVVLSLSGYSGPLGAAALADGIRAVQQRGTVVVASAGNDASCRPTIPASLLGVVSVGGIGPAGPAPFSNYGPWVRACAPAVDLVSTFFDRLPRPANPALSDLDDFKGWARWSGTSFAAPAVAAALLRELLVLGEAAARPANGGPAAAVARVIDEPALFRLPGLGTVVNIA